MFNLRNHRASLPRDTLAREIAERSVARTLTLLAADADSMSPAELRGYVRAYALPCVCDEALQLVGREWPKAAFKELVATALEQATHLVVRQIKANPIVSMPTPHVRLRIAA
jgi:hypothetical protein